MSSSNSISRVVGACYLRDTAHALDGVNTVAGIETIQQIVDTLAIVREAGGTVYVAGNGGSAANALHLAGHLGDVGINAVCHVANPVALTATANDYGYEESLARQINLAGFLYAKANAVVAISCSGRSPNILRWIEDAWMLVGGGKGAWNSERMIGLFGQSSETHRGSIIECIGLPLHVDSPESAVVEDVHSAVIHAMTKMLAPPESDTLPEDFRDGERHPSG